MAKTVLLKSTKHTMDPSVTDIVVKENWNIYPVTTKIKNFLLLLKTNREISGLDLQTWISRKGIYPNCETVVGVYKVNVQNPNPQFPNLIDALRGWIVNVRLAYDSRYSAIYRGNYADCRSFVSSSQKQKSSEHFYISDPYTFSLRFCSYYNHVPLFKKLGQAGINNSAGIFGML